MNRPLIVTSGDPAGIGPDICLQLFAQMHGAPTKHHTHCVFLGDREVFNKRAQLLGIDVPIRVVSSMTQDADDASSLKLLHIPCPVPVFAGAPSSAYAPHVIEQLQTAVTLCQHKHAQAIVTAPVSKQHIQTGGYEFVGHTEWLADAFGVKQVVMGFMSETIKVALVTTHLPLAEVSKVLSKQRIVDTLLLVAHSAQHLFAVAQPQLCVLALNPHAGEGGALGKEEQQHITPAIEQAQALGINAFGPLAADSFFLDERYTKDTFVIAMYHDQILPLVKYTDFSGSVNITLGLPVVRTSVDHGTAFALAGTNKSSPNNLVSAIRLAQRRCLSPM